MKIEDVRDRELVERGLRLLIGQTHDAACMARLECRRSEVVEGLDQEYEDVLDVFRRVIGKEATTS